MTDLESREKKRGPPPKLQPLNIAQPKDKDAHLAAYFGEGSLPFNTPSLNIRPPKRGIFSKVNNNTSHSAATGPTLATNNTRDTACSSSNSTGPNADSKDSSIQSSSTAATASTIPRSGHHTVVPERESGADVTDTTAESLNLHRLRSGSRLTRQEPLQKREYTPATESDKPTSTEPMGTTSEPKVAFAPPQGRISRNTEGKENLTPLTSLNSRTNARKSLSTKSSTPRKSFNWGRPSREAGTELTEQEESKGSTSSSNDITLVPKFEQGVDTAPLTAAAAVTLPNTPDDSGSTSVELAIQNLQVEDAADGPGSGAGSGSGAGPGPARGRQGTKRDIDEASSAPKRRKEFHPQHGEGIASIAQSLAVGSLKAAPLSRPFVNTPENQGRSGSRVMSPPVAPASLPIGSNTSRPELGSRPVMMINNRPYTRLAQVGKGGSSKVYKVLSTTSKIMALKKVSFENADRSTVEGFMNEVNLLKRLVDNSRIIRLYDAEVNHAKGYLCLLMEYGEIDLAHMLHAQQSQPFDIHFIGLYWRQMLEAVQVIHDLKIVHSDLKPANFLLVEGSLKLIDFGIANAIANDTTNIHREGQLGTANYMSPESISFSTSAGGCRKMGKASDVWSLGCILYQMVYGRTPFANILNVFNKLAVIVNPNNKIKFYPTTRSPMYPKQPAPQPPPLAGDENGGGSEAVSLATAGTDVATEVADAGAANVTSSSVAATSSSTPEATIVPTMIQLDHGLIRIMKGCLEYHVADRLTIPKLLADPFLQPFGSFTTSAPSSSSNSRSGLSEAEAGEGAGETVSMDVDTLHQVVEASMVFAVNLAASQGTSDSSSARGAGVIDEAVVKSATKQVLRQLHAKKSNGNRPGGFVIS
ncbi:Dual-specificity kinase, spindle pole body (SPB) duplication and spindle checkpoint function [Mortierella sp. 14UC]|nr:Dual-specificity kinase, spindle pole body (SPB) duplication and spindle checkpoint function [Mortierella sp. 14UC]